MKIVQINAVNEYGSTGRTCKELSNYLRSINHECYTLFSIGKEDEYDIKISTYIESKIHSLLSHVFGLQGYFSYFSTYKTVNIIKKLNPDIVMIRNIHSNFINQNVLFSFLSSYDIPTVICLDDCWFYTGGCTHYTTQKCNRWMKGCGKCPNKNREGTNWLFDTTSKVFNDRYIWYHSIQNIAVIGVSNWITSEAKKSILFHDKTLFECVYNWIDTDVFNIKDVSEYKEKFGLTNKKIILGVASCWNEKKGLSDFINLADKLKNNYTIILVGKIKKGKILPNNMISVGSINNIDDLVIYYNLADVFVTLSKEESFGKVSAEALSCGTPVICYDSTANKEIVGLGCGKVVEINNINDIVKNIYTITYSKKSKYSKKCRNFVIENFDKNKCISAYITIFNKLIEKKK